MTSAGKKSRNLLSALIATACILSSIQYTARLLLRDQTVGILYVSSCHENDTPAADAASVVLEKELAHPEDIWINQYIMVHLYPY